MLCPYFLLEKEVKQKINSLRSYYSNELAKSSAKDGAGTDKVYQSKWPFFFIHWNFYMIQHSQKQLRLLLIKYLKYQTTKYSKETLINTPAATEKCSLKIVVPKF